MDAMTKKAVLHIAECAVYYCNIFSLKSAKGVIHGMITNYGEQGVCKENLESIFDAAISAKRKDVFVDACDKSAADARWSK